MKLFGPITLNLSPKEQHQPRKTGLNCTVAEKRKVFSPRALNRVSKPNLSCIDKRIVRFESNGTFFTGEHSEKLLFMLLNRTKFRKF